MVLTIARRNSIALEAPTTQNASAPRNARNGRSDLRNSSTCITPRAMCYGLNRTFSIFAPHTSLELTRLAWSARRSSSIRHAHGRAQQPPTRDGRKRPPPRVRDVARRRQADHEFPAPPCVKTNRAGLASMACVPSNFDFHEGATATRRWRRPTRPKRSSTRPSPTTSIK